ncbi:MAG: hypothetical protein J5697_01860, partial [Clostridia bacterium]|nr:hypothetical protein [Clostridia bacterium]
AEYIFCGRFGDSGAGGVDLGGNYTGAVVFDSTEYVAERTGAAVVYSYRRSEKYKNGESAGIYKFRFN